MLNLRLKTAVSERVRVRDAVCTSAHSGGTNVSARIASFLRESGGKCLYSATAPLQNGKNLLSPAFAPL
nr:hypothetical protein [uncultured Pseudoxanthomonas sp.]